MVGTDLLNAAYWARAPATRRPDDLRLAFAILTTALGAARARAPRLPDVAAFHRAFGLRRLRGDGGRQGTLSRAGCSPERPRCSATSTPPAVPDDGEPPLAVKLTTHAGHFLGAAQSRLLAYRDADGAWLLDVGAWDPLPWYLAEAYERAGAQAQREFWGPAHPEASMLAQMALG